jgi:hypothetical protein
LAILSLSVGSLATATTLAEFARLATSGKELPALSETSREQALKFFDRFDEAPTSFMAKPDAINYVPGPSKDRLAQQLESLVFFSVTPHGDAIFIRKNPRPSKYAITWSAYDKALCYFAWTHPADLEMMTMKKAKLEPGKPLHFSLFVFKYLEEVALTAIATDRSAQFRMGLNEQVVNFSAPYISIAKNSDIYSRTNFFISHVKGMKPELLLDILRDNVGQDCVKYLE